MNVTEFFKKNWIHFALVAAGLIVIAIYFKPQLEGYGVKQHDIEQWQGMSREITVHRNQTGQEALWTNSMFGGMPAEQISVVYPGNWFTKVTQFYFSIFPNPIGTILLHFLCFYAFARFLKIRPLIGLIGAFAFSFASYELIIIQAGHITKSMTVAFLPAVLGAFIYAFRTNRKWGMIFSGFFMALELAMNHLQVTYYFSFVLFFVGFYFLIEAIQQKKIKSFFITAAGVIGFYAIAVFMNIGNIWLTADYAKNTIRGANDVTISSGGTSTDKEANGLEIDYITQWSYGVGETFTLLSPYVKGGGSMALADSPFSTQIDENPDLTSAQINSVKGNNAYWGEQPSTSGPVYLGVIVCFLAFLGLFFMKDKIKWPLFIVTVIVIMLSWGKNFMGLTEWMVENFPMYNKFRAVTIILVIAELTIPILGVLFLNSLIDEREAIKEKKNKLFGVIGGFVVFLIILKVMGLGDNYTNPAEVNQFSAIDVNIRNQIMGMDPEVAKTQYNLDLTNAAQVEQFVSTQAQNYEQGFQDVKKVREDIFNSSMNRSILFCLLAAGLILFFVLGGTEIKTATAVLGIGMTLLVIADLLPVANNYLGSSENEQTGLYKFWEEKNISAYPIAATGKEMQVMEAELTQNPTLKSKISKAESAANSKAGELGLEGISKRNYVNAEMFSALNSATNFRVFDLTESPFNSTHASYFFKSIGGYHGAKLRNIQNLIDFHVSKMNNKVLDMLNVKYIFQKDGAGNETANPNVTALGNAWLVKKVETQQSANDEILALGTEFTLTNKGSGTLFINEEIKNAGTVYGTEKLEYVLPGKDTIPVQLSNGLDEGMEAMLVMDVNGKTNLVPMTTMALDTAKSFTPLVSLKVTKTFNPKDEAVMLAEIASKLPSKTFSGVGTIKMKSYSPNKITYTADVSGKQLAVFSEIYYPLGWKAFVDGKEVEILKVDYLLRGLSLSNGKHKIEFVYDLPKYHIATTIASIFSLVLILSFLGLGFVEYRKKKQTAQ